MKVSKFHCLILSSLNHLCRLMINGYRNPLTDNDLWDLNNTDKAREVAPLITTEWNKEMRKAK